MGRVLTGVAALWRLDFGLYPRRLGLTLLLRGDQAWSARIALAARYAAVAFLTGLAGYLPLVSPLARRTCTRRW